MKQPYYAVIFTNLQTSETDGYSAMAQKMEDLAKQQSGYIGMEHVRDQIGITISYWKSLQDIAQWKSNLDHLEAQSMGKSRWYEWYTTRICKVEREYSFSKK